VLGASGPANLSKIAEDGATPAHYAAQYATFIILSPFTSNLLTELA
jgi:hypothetical protein